MSRIESEIREQSTRRATIPTVLTSFVGREHEMVEVTRLLSSSRLVTLTGAAGCGKTRLALRVAADMSELFVDGVHWIELARLADSGLVLQAVARAVNVVEQSSHPLVDQLIDVLHDKQLLLVLDNCEHVLSMCAQLVAVLLEATDVSILATSREPLRAMGEMRLPVSPLPLPPAAHTTVDIDQFDAVRLFIERARAIVPDFALTPDNVGAVAGICQSLDGIPLAIELASAGVNVLTVEQIAARLGHDFELLPPAAHVTHSHHRTLRAAIDWSYDSLSAPERVMLRRMSVFAGGCSLTTAETICAGHGVEREQVLELLSSLVNKSLIVAETLQRGEARYSLLQPIRQYAQEKLSASGEWSIVRDQHLQCFLQLTEETAPKLTGPYQLLWLNWLEGEYDNIRYSLSWSLESNLIEAGLRTAIALYEFWTIRDYVEEGLTWFERLLPRTEEEISAVVHAKALAYAAFLAGFRGNTAAQLEYGREAATLAEAAGNDGRSSLVWALAAQGYAARAAGDYQTEFTIAKRMIQVSRELEDPYGLGVVLSVYSPTAVALGEYDAAHAMLAESLPLLREAGNTYRIAMALNFSGDLARCERNYVQARSAYEESICMLRELDAVRDLASALHNLGHTYLHLGDVERARVLIRESMDLHQAQQNAPGMAECLIGFAALAIARELPAAGTRLLAAAEANGEQHIASLWAATRMEYEQYLARARANLTQKEFQTEQVAGHTVSLEQAVEYARNLPLNVVAGPGVQKKPDELTVRERQVTALIAHARSNEEIAEELVVSKRTVEKHIANIRSKLSFTERTQIVRWAIETQLVNLTGDDPPGE